MGTRVPFSAFFITVNTKIAPVVDYIIKLTKFISGVSPLFGVVIGSVRIIHVQALGLVT